MMMIIDDDLGLVSGKFVIVKIMTNNDMMI